MNIDEEGQVRIKAEIMCLGIRPDAESEKLYSILNPQTDSRTGNAGLGFSLGNLYVNAPFGHRFTRNSPYTVTEGDNSWFIRKGWVRYPIVPNMAPEWYMKQTSNGTPLTELMIEEGNNMLVTAIYDSCGYFSRGEQCKFCGINKNHNIVKKSPVDLAEAIGMAVEENPRYWILWTGGNTYTPDKGALNYLEAIRELRKGVGNPVACEMAPPDENKYLDMLLEAGVNNFDFNIEIWDDALRKEICPGKSMIPKERYFEVWEYCLDVIGKNSMETAFVVGFESVDSIREGVEELTSRGIIPTALPFHPNDSSVYEDEPPCDPSILVEVSKIISDNIKTYGLDPLEHLSCQKCGACTIEVDMLG